MGRPPLGEKPMTGIEKNRRMLTRRKLLNEAAKEHGYRPTTVFLNEKQIGALKELEQGKGNVLNSKALNQALFRALKYALEHSTSGLQAIHQNTWPQHCEIDMIYIVADRKFRDWEQNNQTKIK